MGDPQAALPLTFGPTDEADRVPIEIGRIEALFRYPVKSMRGESLDAATLGWHGLEGDRRFAFRRLDERGGLPWLTASKLPDLVLFTPQRREDENGEVLPTHVRTPEGETMPMFGEALAAEVGRRHGAPVQMMQLNHGIFDETSISVISLRHRSRDRPARGNDRRRPTIPSEHRRPIHARESPSRRINGWAACSRSAKGTMRPPSPSRCATFAVRW